MGLASVSQASGPSRLGKVIDRVRRRSLFDIVTVALGLAVAGAILYPLWFVIKGTFVVRGRLTVEPFRSVFDDHSLGSVLRNTAIIASTSTIAAVVLAAVFAWLNERTDARIGWLARILPLVPLLIPAAAAAVGWVSLLSPVAGLLNLVTRDVLGALGIDMTEGPIRVGSMYVLIFLYTVTIMPFAYVILQPAFQNLDPALEEAARVSGANTSTMLRRVTLPAILPSLTSAMLLTGVVSLALFSIPMMIGKPAGIDVISTRVYRYLTSTYPPQTGPALALTSVVLCFTIACVVLQRRMMKRQRHATITGKRNVSSLVSLGRWRIAARGLLLSYVLVAAIIPFGGLLYLSTQKFWSGSYSFSLNTSNFREVFRSGGQTRESMINSAVLGLIAATLAILVATIVANRAHRSGSRIGRASDGIMKVPATISQLVLGVGILLAFSGPPFRLSGTKPLIVLGLFIAYIHLASFTANAAVGQVAHELTEAAAVNRASPFRTFRRIQLPLMTPALIGGWILVYVASIGDITIVALLSTTNTQVIGYRILSLQDTGSYPELAALGVVVTLMTTSVVLAVTFAFNRRTSSR